MKNNRKEEGDKYTVGQVFKKVLREQGEKWYNEGNSKCSKLEKITNKKYIT